MNLVDSSGWLEYFSEGHNADFFSRPITDIKSLIVPTICIFEVFKRLFILRGEGDALFAMASMYQGQVVDLNQAIAVAAAKFSVAYKIPMADSIILATASQFQAVTWTQDVHFHDLPDVKYIPKR